METVLITTSIKRPKLQNILNQSPHAIASDCTVRTRQLKSNNKYQLTCGINWLLLRGLVLEPEAGKMGEEVDAVLMKKVKETQEVLGQFVRKPPLTEKHLMKPPFRFLHDIITNVSTILSN